MKKLIFILMLLMPISANAVLYTNSFSGSEPPDNTSYTNIKGSYSYSIDTEDFTPINTGLLTTSGVGVNNHFITYYNLGNSWVDYYNQVTVVATNYWLTFGLINRLSTSNPTQYYLASINHTNGTIDIYKGSNIIFSGTGNFTDGDVIKFVSEGVNSVRLTLYINNIQIIQCYDSNSPYTSGTIGYFLQSEQDDSSVSIFITDIYVDTVNYNEPTPTPTPAVTATPTPSANHKTGRFEMWFD